MSITCLLGKDSVNILNLPPKWVATLKTTYKDYLFDQEPIPQILVTANSTGREATVKDLESSIPHRLMIWYNSSVGKWRVQFDVESRVFETNQMLLGAAIYTFKSTWLALDLGVFGLAQELWRFDRSCIMLHPSCPSVKSSCSYWLYCETKDRVLFNSLTQTLSIQLCTLPEMQE